MTKKMITLNGLLDEWEQDCKIDDINLVRTARAGPELHSKYIKYRASIKLKYKKVILDQKILLKQKWLYYNGKMTQEEIEEHEWEYDPFKGLKVLKGEMDRYYDADIDIQESEEKIEYYKILLESVDEIVKSINWRGNTIKNIIDWKKFQAGEF